MAQDAPDWQLVVNVSAGPALSDAPDWEKVVVGPGGSAIGGGGADFLDWHLDGSYLQTLPASLTTSSTYLTTAIVLLTKLAVTTAKTVSKCHFYVTGNGGTPVANQNYVGLYSYAPAGAMTLVATTAAGACDAAFGSAATTPWTIDLAASASLAVGTDYYAAVLANTSVVGSLDLPAIYPPFGIATEGIDGLALVFFTQPATLAYTSLPASIAAANLTAGVFNNFAPFFMAYS